MKHQNLKEESSIGVPSHSCSVCGDISTGIHFGGNSCESCKAFFRRSVQCNRHRNYKCSNDEQCLVNVVTRKVCQYCRYNKCITIGMKSKWVLSDQEREEKYGTRRKKFRENVSKEEDPDIYKHLKEDEKLLIEDIAHALYQSRVTYPLQFSTDLSQHLSSLSSSSTTTTPTATTATTTTTTTTNEKQSSANANFLVVPIQRLVLFARMLKDFDLFTEDDRVNLLKGSAVEVIVCSANTLFDSKTQTFINYISRDQQTVIDEKIIPLDPLLKKIWGEELFERTKTFLISMCNLHIDEVTTTLLIPVILFSPDRSNIKQLDLVKNLQNKYVDLLLKYMNWRYGIEHTKKIFPKLLLQIINIRTLSLSHLEILQKVMPSSNVNPLVQEVTRRNETTENNSKTILSTFNQLDSLRRETQQSINDEKMTSTDVESSIGSDDEDINRKKSRRSIEDEEKSKKNHSKNIWNKQETISSFSQIEISNHKDDKNHLLNLDFKSTLRKPHDHQVPNSISSSINEQFSNRSTSFRHLPPKKQTLYVNRDCPSAPIDQRRTTMESFDSTQNFSSYSNEENPTFFSQENDESGNSRSELAPEEQRLLDAIHSHPNKRDLVLNLLRQMNETSSTTSD